MYDHQPPRAMPPVRKIQAVTIQFRDTVTQGRGSPLMEEARARQAGMVNPPYPRNKRGGWKIMPGLRSRGLRPVPLICKGRNSTNGLLQQVRSSKKKACTTMKYTQNISRVF